MDSTQPPPQTADEDGKEPEAMTSDPEVPPAQPAHTDKPAPEAAPPYDQAMSQGPPQGEPIPAPVNAYDAANNHPPPAYQQVMGQNMTSLVFAEPELPPLAYIDIMPQIVDPGNIRYNKSPTFQKFSEIMVGANMWLQSYPNLLCWKCETVERRVDVGPRIDLGAMSHHESAQGFNVHVLGLRLWFTKKMDRSPPQQLGLMNIAPDDLLSTGIDNLNRELAVRPILGSILNIETATLKYSAGYSKFDPDATCYSELGAGGFSARRIRQILRIFYVMGPPRMEQIFLQEFKPVILRHTGSNAQSKFQPHSTVLMAAQQWLQMQAGIKVVNIETRDVQAVEKNKVLEIRSDNTSNFVPDKDCMYVKIVRIFYVGCPEVTSYATTFLTSRLFTPVRIGDKAFEDMTTTMARVVSWLSQTQAPIFSVETISYPFVDNDLGLNPERTDLKVQKGGGKRYVTAIRLYFPTMYQEPGYAMIQNQVVLIPQQQMAPPQMQTAPPPMANAPPPGQNAPPPYQNAPPPSENAPPPMQNAPLPGQNAPPPPQNAQPQGQYAPPPAQQNTQGQYGEAPPSQNPQPQTAKPQKSSSCTIL